MVVKSPLALMALAGVVAAGLGSAALAQQGPMNGPEMMMSFDAVDANKDGKITPDELEAFRKARAAEADLNKDGMVSAEEMVAFGEQMRAERKLLRAKEMIARFDTNKDGQLSLDEMPASKEPGKMFSRIDTDGDGAISKAEADEMKAKIANRMDKNRDGKGKYHDKGHGGFWFWGDDEGDN